MNASNIHSRRAVFVLFAGLLFASFSSLLFSQASFASTDTYRRVNNQTIKYTSTPTTSGEAVITRYYHADKPQESWGDVADESTYFWRVKPADNNSQLCQDFIVNNSRFSIFQRFSTPRVNGACAQTPTSADLTNYVDSGKDIFFYKSSADNVIRPADQTASDSEFAKVMFKNEQLSLSGQQAIYIQTKPAVTCPRLLVAYADDRWGFTAPKPTDTAQSGTAYDYYFKILTEYGYDTSNVGGCKVSDSNDVRANNEKALSDILGGSEAFWRTGFYGDWFSFIDLKGVAKPLGNIVGTESAAEIRLGTTPTGSLDGTTSGFDAEGAAETTTTCPVEGLGWIVCPVINGLATLNDGMWSLVSSLLTVNPLQQTDNIYDAWKVVRNLANVAFVIVFLIIIFSQLSSLGITNYGVKKMLPRLVIGAILVNVSFIVVQLAVDVSNILGSGLYNLMVGQAPATVPTWTGLITTLTTIGITTGGLVAGVAMAGGAAAAFWVVLPLAAMAALGILAALLTLLFRQAVIPVLAILAPLAFVAFLLPNTASLFKKWQSLLTSLLMLYVTAAFVFGGARFASAVMFKEGEWWAHLTALIVLALPLFSLPFLAKQGGPMLSKVGGALNGLASKASKPIGSWAKPKQDLARDKYQATPASKYNIGKRINLRGRRLGQINDLKSSAYKAQQAADFSKDLRENTEEYANQMPQGSVAQSHIKGAASRAEAEALKSEMAPLISEIAAEKARQGSAFDLDEHLRERVKSSSGTQRAAAIHYAAALGRDNIMRELLEPGQDPETKRFAQEAVSANAGALINKAPDLVKPISIAFDTVTGEDLTKFSTATMGTYVKYLDGLHAAATAPGATQKDKDKLATASASFNSAIEDITQNTTLQASFSSGSGTAIVAQLADATTSAAFQSYASSNLHGLAAIQPDGKIR